MNPIKRVRASVVEIKDTPKTVTVCRCCELVPSECSGHHGVRPSLVRNADGSLITKEIMESQHRETNRNRAEIVKRWSTKE